MAAEVDKIDSTMEATGSRWTLAWAWLAGLIVYGIAIFIASDSRNCSLPASTSRSSTRTYSSILLRDLILSYAHGL